MSKNLTRPATVWRTGQPSIRRRSANRYVGATRSDIALTPDVARRIIATYTAPGDTVCDPHPGPGVVLAEAIRSGRHALGLTTQPRWESVLQANLDFARLAGNTGTVTLLHSADDPRAAELPGAVDVVLTGVRHGPTSDPSHVLVELYEDLTAVTNWVWPGGHVIITCRPWRRRGRLVDLPGKIHDLAEVAGLAPADECIALTARAHNGHLRPHAHNGTGGIDSARPIHIDVLVFRVPQSAKSGDR